MENIIRNLERILVFATFSGGPKIENPISRSLLLRHLTFPTSLMLPLFAVNTSSAGEK